MRLDGEDQRAKRWFQIYSVYNFLKYVGCASVLVYFAVTRKAAIENSYNLQVCNSCYDQARQHPDTYFEFGKCSNDFLPNANDTNLFLSSSRWWSWNFGASTSTVSSYVLTSSLNLVLVALICAASLFLAFPGDRLDANSVLADLLLSMTAFLSIVILLASSSNLFQLYQHNGCFISAWGEPYIIASTALLWAFIAAWIIFETSRCFDSVCWSCFGAFSLLAAVLAYLVFAVVLAYVNFKTSGDRTHLLFAVALLLTSLEIPYCIFGPRIKAQWDRLLHREQQRGRRDYPGV